MTARRVTVTLTLTEKPIRDDIEQRTARGHKPSRWGKARDVAHAQEITGIDWMTDWDDLADAIPPAYTEFIGAQLLDHLRECAA